MKKRLVHFFALFFISKEGEVEKGRKGRKTVFNLLQRSPTLRLELCFIKVYYNLRTTMSIPFSEQISKKGYIVAHRFLKGNSLFLWNMNVGREDLPLAT